MFIHESLGFCNAGAQMNGESQEKRMNMVWKPNICGGSAHELTPTCGA